MIKRIGKLLFGTGSGKREQAWIVFFGWAAAFGWAAYKEALGIAMPGTQSILSAALLPVISNLVVAHGMEWHSRQSRWQGEGDGE